MTIENLKIGMWIIITNYAEQERGYEDSYSFMFGRHSSPQQIPIPPMGIPLRIEAIECPFIVISNTMHPGLPVDFRNITGFKEVGSRYVRMMEEAVQRQQHNFLSQPIYGYRGNPLKPASTKGRRRKKEKPDPKTCPRCGNMYVQKLFDPGDSSKWKIWCPVCQYGPEDQDPVT